MSLFQFKIPFDTKFYETLDIDSANLIVRNDKSKINGLSNTKKMNCLSWSISADHCITGSKIREIEGSTCSKCYAKRGHYLIGRTVKRALAQRYDAWQEQEHWLEAIVFLINISGKRFRWFDAGDIQSEHHLLQILEASKRSPRAKHWLPTQEREMVSNVVKQGYQIPENLTIRLSSIMIDGEPPTALANELNHYPNVLGHIGTSGVLSKEKWEKSNTGCPSSLQGNNCGTCDRCWGKTNNVDYKKH